ncbi:hypothetical protein ACIQ9R_35850 [Streptomyces sp. NPDC094447]|uniref:hypothetical protein n=1 Tax=Streptomyces sp. NPDC094447 TaxID=3366062 RepID=UPI0037FEC093
MQIDNAADRRLASIETKRLRRPWNPDLHPRDSKGRFIETGGIARLWGGGMARVLRALGGRNVLVEDMSTRQQSTVHASRLTMVARPDGTAPTRSKRKVRDEDERRAKDTQRGAGTPDQDDAGDNGQTPDDPYDKDDQGDDIGEDVEGEDQGEGPEPEDDDPFIPQGRVMSNDKDDNGELLPEAAKANRATRHYPNLLRIDGETRRSGHVAGRGDALRARGPKKTKNDPDREGKFHDTDHARSAVDELNTDYFADLQAVWSQDWDNREAGDAYGYLSNLDGKLDLDEMIDGKVPYETNKPKTDSSPDDLDTLRDFAEDAERLAELAETDGRPEVARYAQNLADALNLALQRFEAHGGAKIPKPKKNGKPTPRAWQDEPVPQPKTAAPRRAAAKKPTAADNRRFKTLADVRQHWASGQLTPFTDDEERQKRHAAAVRKVYAELQGPQMSKGGTFVVAKTMIPRGDGTPEARYVIDHIATGGQLTSFGRKAEAVDFANRLENAQVDGKPFDWDAPGLNDRLQEEGAQKEFGRLLAETQKAYDDKARKKSGGMRQQPNPEGSEATAAQQITNRTGAPRGHRRRRARRPRPGHRARGRPNEAEPRERAKRRRRAAVPGTPRHSGRRTDQRR